MTPIARRVMALLVGLHHQEPKRIDRYRIARAVKRSPRTVKRAISELESYGWVEAGPGGNGTPGSICVINDKDWIMAPVSRNGPGLGKDGPGLGKDGPGFARIRSEEVLSKGKQAHPSEPVENEALAEFLEIERFATAHGLPMNNGGDFDRAFELMRRKPVASEGLTLVAGAGRS